MQKIFTYPTLIQDLEKEEKTLLSLIANHEVESPSTSIINNILNYSRNLEIIQSKKIGAVDVIKS